MSVTLAPKIEQQIRRLIDSGQYPDVDTLIEKALQALAEQEQARFEQTRALILACRDGGAGDLLTPALWERMEREAEEDERCGVPIRDEVIP